MHRLLEAWIYKQIYKFPLEICFVGLFFFSESISSFIDFFFVAVYAVLYCMLIHHLNMDKLD